MEDLNAQAEAAAPAEDPPPRRTGRARLDNDGVYLGVEAIDAAKLQPGDVEVPVDCDLAPGRYRWDAELSTFGRLQGTAPIMVPVTAEVALAGVIAALRDANIALPETAARWADQFTLGLDGLTFR